MQPNFNTNAKDCPQRPYMGGDPRFADLRGKLFVDRPEQWDEAVGIDPVIFHGFLARDLPGDVSILMTLKGGGQGEMDITCRQDGRTLLTANRFFNKKAGTLTLHEVKIADENLRGRGLGKVFLENTLDLAEKWGLPRIDLRAGRENGSYYWARRGAVIADAPGAAPEKQPIALFENSIRERLDALKDSISGAFKEAVEKTFETSGRRANVEIARLPHKTNDGTRQAALALIQNIEYRARIDLNDLQQMQDVRQKLGNMEQTRARLQNDQAFRRADYVGVAPQKLEA